MSGLYSERQFIYPATSDEDSKSTINGNAWQATATDAGYVVNYISGELAGRPKSLAITEQEFEQLRVHQIELDELLIKYGVN